MASPASEIEVFGIQFGPEGGMVVSFMMETDVRVGGALQMQKALSLNPAHPDYAEDAEYLLTRIKKMLRSALEDFEESLPYVPTDEGDEDDDRGMGE